MQMNKEGDKSGFQKMKNEQIANNAFSQKIEANNLQQSGSIRSHMRPQINFPLVQNKEQQQRWEELIKFINCHTQKLKQSFNEENRQDIQQMNLHYLKLQWKLGHYLGRLELPALNKIDLTENYLGPKGIQQMSKCQWPNLQVLDIKNNLIKNQGFKHLVKVKWPKLQNLTINYNEIKSLGMLSIRYSEWHNLKQLYLRGNKIGLRGISTLAKISLLNLNTLDVGSCGLGLEALKKLTRANWEELILLNLTMNFIGDEGIRILAKSNWPKLQYLELQYNQIRSGLRLLRGRWPEMRFPFLYGNRATVEMIQDTVAALIVKS